MRSFSMTCVAILLCLVAASLNAQAFAQAETADLADEWLEDPVVEKPAPTVEQTKEKPLSMTEALKEYYWRSWESSKGNKLKTEVVLLVFIAAYIVNIFVGRSRNDKVARAWAEAFCRPEGIFDKNFTMVGIGAESDVPLLKESASEYRLYCSGRRHCKSLHAVLKLKNRQDLFSILISFIWPTEDKVDIDVYMKEGTLPLTVFAIATKKLMRSMIAEETGEDDVRKFTRRLDVQAQGWPSDKLAVYGEHSSIFQGIVNERLQEQIFRRPAFNTQGKYFRMLHFTPEQSYGPKDQRSVLRFSFALPPENQMEELTKLLSSVGVFIDLMANFELSPDLQKRAVKLREDAERKEETEKSKREDAAEERRNAKRFDEMERLKKMTPEQREKYQEKKQKLMQSRQQRKYTRRM